MKIPHNSLLCGGSYDYTDSFTCTLRDSEGRIGPEELASTFNRRNPAWVEALLALRNRLVAPFGLKTSRSEDDGAQRYGMFSVFGRTDDEILLGQDDRHLDFRVSLLLEPAAPGLRHVTVTTAVKFHNRLGRCYFALIKPFHRIIVPAVLRRNFRRLEAGN